MDNKLYVGNLPYSFRDGDLNKRSAPLVPCKAPK